MDLFHNLSVENQICVLYQPFPFQFLFLLSADIGRAIVISVSPALAILLVIIVMVMAFLLWKKGMQILAFKGVLARKAGPG